MYDFAEEKNAMIVAKITAKNSRHSAWTLAWFWSQIVKLRPWQHFVKNSTKLHLPIQPAQTSLHVH